VFYSPNGPFDIYLTIWEGATGDTVGLVRYNDCVGELVLIEIFDVSTIALAEQDLTGTACGKAGAFVLYWTGAESQIEFAWLPYDEEGGYDESTTRDGVLTRLVDQTSPQVTIQWLIEDGSQDISFAEVWPGFDVADSLMIDTNGGFVAEGEWSAESIQSGDHFLFGFAFGGTYDPAVNLVRFPYLAIASTDGRWWIMTWEDSEWRWIVQGENADAMTLIGLGQGYFAQLQVDSGWAQLWVNGYWLGEADIGSNPAGVVVPILGREGEAVGAPVYSVFIYNYAVGLFS